MKYSTFALLVLCSLLPSIYIVHEKGWLHFGHCKYVWIVAKSSSLHEEYYVCSETGEEIGHIYLEDADNDRWRYYYNAREAFFGFPDMGERFTKEAAKRVVERDAR